MNNRAALIRRVGMIREAYLDYIKERDDVNEYVHGRRLGLISGMIALSKSSSSSAAYEHLKEVNNGLIPEEYLPRINLIFKILCADTMAEVFDAMDEVDECVTNARMEVLDRLNRRDVKVEDDENQSLFKGDYNEEAQRSSLRALSAIGKMMDVYEETNNVNHVDTNQSANLEAIKRLSVLKNREVELQTLMSPYEYGENRKKNDNFHQMAKELADVQNEIKDLKNGVITDRDLEAASFVYHLLSTDSMEKAHEMINNLVNYGSDVAKDVRKTLQGQVTEYEHASDVLADKKRYDDQYYEQKRQTDLMEKQAADLEKQKFEAEWAAREAKSDAARMCRGCGRSGCAMRGCLKTPMCGAFIPRK